MVSSGYSSLVNQWVGLPLPLRGVRCTQSPDHDLSPLLSLNQYIHPILSPPPPTIIHFPPISSKLPIFLFSVPSIFSLLLLKSCKFSLNSNTEKVVSFPAGKNLSAGATILPPTNKFLRRSQCHSGMPADDPVYTIVLSMVRLTGSGVA